MRHEAELTQNTNSDPAGYTVLINLPVSLRQHFMKPAKNLQLLRWNVKKIMLK